jgi:sensor domain CHASE-containing protein
MAVESSLSVLYGGRAPVRLSSQLSRTAFVMLIAVAVVSIAGLYWSTRQSDEVSVERQVRVTRHSVDIALDELAQQQETVAVWDEAALYMTRPETHQQWLHDNIGFWLHRIFAHDEVFLLDGRDRLVQADSEGRVVPASRYEALRGDVAPLLLMVRGERECVNGPHDRHAGRPLLPNSTVRTTERAVHETHLTMVGGRPAAVSAMLIKPSTEGFVRPRPEWPVLISVRYLDASFMSELQSRYLIDAPRFSLRPERQANEVSAPLATEGGRKLGYIIWKPELPGRRILNDLLPFAVSALSVLAVLMLLLTRSLKQTLNERAAFEARAAHLAYHDSLTGLPNRALMNERLQHSLAALQRGGTLSLLLIEAGQRHAGPPCWRPVDPRLRATAAAAGAAPGHGRPPRRRRVRGDPLRRLEAGTSGHGLRRHHRGIPRALHPVRHAGVRRCKHRRRPRPRRGERCDRADAPRRRRVVPRQSGRARLRPRLRGRHGRERSGPGAA